MKLEKPIIMDIEKFKILRSENYNYMFNKENGFFARWGKTKEEDPDFSPYGPEIADIEVTTKCYGVTGCDGKTSVCKFCYKSNSPAGENMSLDTFKKIFHRICGAKIIIELENNEIIKLDPEVQILLKNGDIISAENLSESHEIKTIIQ